MVSLPAENKSIMVSLWLTSLFVGAFIAAPVGGLLWGGGAFALRIGFQWSQAKRKGHRFSTLDRPSLTQPSPYSSGAESSDEEPEESGARVDQISVSPSRAKTS